MQPVLSVRDLEVVFKTPGGFLHAVNGISLSVRKGEMIGLVGESGCGKSISMLSLMDLVPHPGSYSAKSIQIDGQEITTFSKDQKRALRGKTIAMIFQNPMTALNPVLTIGRQLTEPLMLHCSMTRAEAEDRAVELLAQVGIASPQDQLRRFPHQFSGGMLQRIVIAMGVACGPTLLLADEPTTALDVTIQAQIVELVKKMRSEINSSIIWITHDLGVVAGLADRVLVMYAGCIVEDATVDDLFAHPLHPYTSGLLASLPKLSGNRKIKLPSIEGMPPGLLEKPGYCPFYPRCKLRSPECEKQLPSLREVTPGHSAACFHAS